jgi:hypothetical protein
MTMFLVLYTISMAAAWLTASATWFIFIVVLCAGAFSAGLVAITDPVTRRCHSGKIGCLLSLPIVGLVVSLVWLAVKHL